MKAAVVVAGVLALIVPLSAQSAPPAGSAQGAVVFPVGPMRAQMASYIAEAKARGKAGTTLEDFGSYTLALVVRGRSSAAEADAHRNEVLMVEQGSATLVTGGRIVDGHRDAQGETRGTRIEGGQRQEIAAGDVLTLRAGTPHQLLLRPGWVMSAFVIRIREQ